MARARKSVRYALMRITCILTLSLLFACGDDKNTTTSGESETGDSSTTDSGTTTTTTTSTTADPTDASGTMSAGQTTGSATDATSVGPTATSDATTGSTSTTASSTGSSTGGGAVDIPGACADVCGKAVTECMLDLGTLEECTGGCVNDLGGAQGACAEATLAYLDCLANMTCDALQEAVLMGNPGECTDAAAQVEVACGGGGECATEIGGNPDMTACSVTTTCPNEPEVSMQCEGKQCVCLIDGQKTGMCPAMDICMMPDALEAKAADCCGF